VSILRPVSMYNIVLPVDYFQFSIPSSLRSGKCQKEFLTMAGQKMVSRRRRGGRWNLKLKQRI